jgi:phospholipid-translocating ATPase
MLFKMCSIAGKAYRGDTEASNDGEEPNSLPDKSPSVDPIAKFSDLNLLQDIRNAANNNTDAPLLDYFFTVLSLCHTVIAATDAETGNIEYKAQSPDEAALVQAAADLGFVFLGKDREILSIRTPRSAEVEKYELLEILEFTSARKRMSVVLRRLDLDSDKDELLLLTKGADNVVFERLLTTEAQEEMKRKTEIHLREFASSGLRTLTLAYKIIPGTFHLIILYGNLHLC